MRLAKGDNFANIMLTAYYVRVSKIYFKQLYIFFYLQYYNIRNFAANGEEIAAHIARTSDADITTGTRNIGSVFSAVDLEPRKRIQKGKRCHVHSSVAKE
jgi:hypothetical protein